MVKAMMYDKEDKVFYLLHNRFRSALGVFVFRFNELLPDKSKHILQIKNNLKIDNCSVCIMYDPMGNHKDLIIANKTIYLNTYTIKVIDLSTEENWILYNIELPQLWESVIKGYPNYKLLDFITINSKGISLLNLFGGPKEFTIGANNQEMLVPAV